jgi:hypothetical protein
LPKGVKVLARGRIFSKVRFLRGDPWGFGRDLEEIWQNFKILEGILSRLAKKRGKKKK